MRLTAAAFAPSLTRRQESAASRSMLPRNLYRMLDIETATASATTAPRSVLCPEETMR